MAMCCLDKPSRLFCEGGVGVWLHFVETGHQPLCNVLAFRRWIAVYTTHVDGNDITLLKPLHPPHFLLVHRGWMNYPVSSVIYFNPNLFSCSCVCQTEQLRNLVMGKRR